MLTGRGFTFNKVYNLEKRAACSTRQVFLDMQSDVRQNLKGTEVVMPCYVFVRMINSKYIITIVTEASIG